MSTDIVSGIKKLGEMVNVAVVKNGAEDTQIFSNGKHIRVSSFKTEVKDTTGAGDNFSAGFIYGLIKGYPLELCGKIASFVASKTIEKIGAQVPENIKTLVETILT
jgi:sugar/nucleoside kinase (ribokinase family)